MAWQGWPGPAVSSRMAVHLQGGHWAGAAAAGKGVSEHSALQGLQHRQKMWKGKKEVKLTCTKSRRKLGIEKKKNTQGFGVMGQELSSCHGFLCSVASSGLGVLHEPCPDDQPAHAQLHFNTQLDGFSQWASREKGGTSAGEIPSCAPEDSPFSSGRG